MLFFHFLPFHMVSSILCFGYTNFCLFWFILSMIYFPNFKMTKHVFLEGTNLKYPPTNQRRDHLLEVFGAIRGGWGATSGIDTLTQCVKVSVGGGKGEGGELAD